MTAVGQHRPQARPASANQQLAMLFQYTVEAYKVFEKLAENLPEPDDARHVQAVRRRRARRPRPHRDEGRRHRRQPRARDPRLGPDLQRHPRGRAVVSRVDRVPDLARADHAAQTRASSSAPPPPSDRNFLVYLEAVKRAHIVELERELELIQARSRLVEARRRRVRASCTAPRSHEHLPLPDRRRASHRRCRRPHPPHRLHHRLRRLRLPPQLRRRADRRRRSRATSTASPSPSTTWPPPASTAPSSSTTPTRTASCSTTRTPSARSGAGDSDAEARLRFRIRDARRSRRTFSVRTEVSYYAAAANSSA